MKKGKRGARLMVEGCWEGWSEPTYKYSCYFKPVAGSGKGRLRHDDANSQG